MPIVNIAFPIVYRLGKNCLVVFYTERVQNFWGQVMMLVFDGCSVFVMKMHEKYIFFLFKP